METISRNYIKNLLTKRSADSHKGTYGKVLIIGGSPGMVGAPVLAAGAAFRGGSGLVQISIDRKLFPIVQSAVVEATCLEGSMSVDFFRQYDSVVIGPGLGTDGRAAFPLTKLMENYDGKVVMDADALNIVSEDNIDLKKTEAKIVITPHPGEAARLINKSVAEVGKNREEVVSFLTVTTDAVAVLKGNNTLVCCPKKENNPGWQTFTNTTGNPGMATGGSGDVLSGLIGSFLGQGMSREDAALAGVYVHGHAGDLAAKELGEYGVIASDIVKYIAYAIKDIQQ